MHSPITPALPLTEKQRSGKIIQWIRFADKRLRRKHPVISRRQNEIGLLITLGSAAGMIVFAVLYVCGLIPFWLCIVANAIFASFLHEMEHDLIHSLYYKENPRMQNFMFWIVWLFRANVVNPWFRKEIHLLHHKVSGNKDDVEERYISNGMPLGFKRLLVMIDPIMALKFQGPAIKKDAILQLRKIKAPHSIGPVREIFLLLWYSFLLLSMVRLGFFIAGAELVLPEWAATATQLLTTAGVIYLIPCWLRQTAIQIVSSNMHYYGSGDSADALQGHALYRQTQVLDSWLIAPLHLFCFNFGATHGIHHFVVNQPFYLRQWVAPYVRPAMKKYGMRFNDFQSMAHSNRWAEV